MKDTFKFERVDNKFLWYDDNIMLELSDPSFQASDDYAYIENVNQMQFFYYNVCIYKHIIKDYKEIYDSNGEYIDDEEIWEWEKVIEKDTYDFPTILQLNRILQLFLDEKIDIKSLGEKHEYLSGEVEYSRTFHSEGFACDDYYEITKYVNPKKHSSYYKMYLGCSFDVQSDINSVGCKTSRLTEGDMRMLQMCVKEFLQYALDIHNQDILERNKVAMSSFYIKDNKVYELVTDHKKKKIKKNQIDRIFTIGEKFDDVIYLDYKNDTNYHSKRLQKVTLVDIKDNVLIFSDDTEVTIDQLLHLFGYMKQNDDRLYFGIDEIAKDFISILNNKEISEFKKKSIDTLLKKYNMAIINRTWMCRSEHNFPINYQTGSTVKEVQPIVKKVIEKIKNSL